VAEVHLLQSKLHFPELMMARQLDLLIWLEQQTWQEQSEMKTSNQGENPHTQWNKNGFKHSI